MTTNLDLPVLFELAGHTDSNGVTWQIGAPADITRLLAAEHYLGPLTTGGAELVIVGARGHHVVAAQVWRRPTSRRLPADGTWLELSRWCLTPAAGPNAGSRQHRYAVRILRDHHPHVTTLVSYSDPSAGHTGALYRACNWAWFPTWLRLRPPPGGHGAWTADEPQAVKDRWIFAVRGDPRRPSITYIDDPAAIRHWRRTAPDHELRWATSHPQLQDAL